MGAFADIFGGGSDDLKSVGTSAPPPPTRENPAIAKDIERERLRAAQGNRASTIFTTADEDLGLGSNARRLGN